MLLSLPYACFFRCLTNTRHEHVPETLLLARLLQHYTPTSLICTYAPCTVHTYVHTPASPCPLARELRTLPRWACTTNARHPQVVPAWEVLRCNLKLLADIKERSLWGVGFIVQGLGSGLAEHQGEGSLSYTTHNTHKAVSCLVCDGKLCVKYHCLPLFQLCPLCTRLEVHTHAPTHARTHVHPHGCRHGDTQRALAHTGTNSSSPATQFALMRRAFLEV